MLGASSPLNNPLYKVRDCVTILIFVSKNSNFLYVYLLDLIILITDKMLKITKINNDTKSK